MITVFVIEDNPTAIIPGLKSLFRPERDGIRINGFATGINDAMKEPDCRNADVIMLDLILKESDPVINIRKFRTVFPAKAVLIFTQNATMDWMEIMMKEKVQGFISKSAGREELKHAIERAATGGMSFTAVTSYSDEKNLNSKKDNSGKLLVGNEKEILQAFVRGKDKSEIARQFDISRWQLNRKIKHVCSRINARSLYDAIHILTEKGEI